MIVVKNVFKEFKLYKKPSDRLKEILFNKKYHTTYTATNDISFVVNDGETLGIIGQNGAGKSTLMKLLMGVIVPDSGEIHTSGKITGLLELGTGFNPNMSGYDNIFMNGMLIGMLKDEIEAKLENIISFSELGDFIYEPLKIYSSGMKMRLAFSIAIHAEPKCFLIDEALSVGDAHFQQKCMKKIQEFKNNGGSIVFVSHDMNAVKVLCDKAILLDKGIVIDYGMPEDIVNKYNFMLAQKDSNNGDIKYNSMNSYGNLNIEIMSLKIKGHTSKTNLISSGEYVDIEIYIHSKIDIQNVTVGIHIRDKYGQDMFGTNTYYQNINVSLSQNKTYICTYSMQLNLGVGKYTIGGAIHSEDWHTENCYHWIDNIEKFEITKGQGNFFIGLCRLYPDISVVEAQ